LATWPNKKLKKKKNDGGEGIKIAYGRKGGTGQGKSYQRTLSRDSMKKAGILGGEVKRKKEYHILEKGRSS